MQYNHIRNHYIYLFSSNSEMNYKLNTTANRPFPFKNIYCVAHISVRCT